MDDEVKKLMASFFPESEADALPQVGESCWSPSADIYQGKDGWLVKFDLAGVQSDDIQLLMTGRQLTVEGIRKDFSILDGQQAYSMEIAYNRFRRSVELPIDLETTNVSTAYRDGMFLVLIKRGDIA